MSVIADHGTPDAMYIYFPNDLLWFEGYLIDKFMTNYNCKIFGKDAIKYVCGMFRRISGELHVML